MFLSNFSKFLNYNIYCRTGLESNERLPNDLDTATLQQLLPQVDVSRVIGNLSDYLESRPNADRECLPKPMPCDHTSKYRFVE
jgi:hypothetical protein